MGRDRDALSEREVEVLRCAARGLSSEATALELSVGAQSVKTYKFNMYCKLGARDIGHAVAIGYQRGLLRLEGDPDPIIEVGINHVRYVPETAPREAGEEKKVTPTDFTLTLREIEILRCAAQGLSNKQIAGRLWIADQTVKFHKTKIFKKMGVRTIGAAIAVGYQRGVLHLEGDPDPGIHEVVVNGVRYVRAEVEEP